MAFSRDNAAWCSERILGLLMTCGRYALERWRHAPWQLKDDGTLVTAVDLAVERMLVDELESVPDGIRVVGEESVARCDEAYLAQAMRGGTFVVDPIDGTAPFAHGIPCWGVSIGRMSRGRLVDGGIALPATNEIFVTDGDRVLWTDRADFATGRLPELGALECRSRPFGPGCLVGLGQRFVRASRFPWSNPTLVTGCAVHALAYLMLGRISAYIGYMKLWDLAAMLPMLLRCGIEVRLVNGTPVTADVRPATFDLTPGSPSRWSLQDDCLFGPPEILDLLLPAVRACLGREC